MRRIVPLALTAAALMLGTPADAAPAGCGPLRDPRVSLNGSSSFVDTRRPGKVWLGGSTWWGTCPVGGIPVTLLQSTGGTFSPIATTTSRADGTYGFPGRAVPRTTDFMVTTSSTNSTPGTKSQIWHVSVSANPTWQESCGNTSFLPPLSAFPELELELDVTDTSVDWGKPVPATLTLTNVSDSGLALAVRSAPWLWLTNRLNGERWGIRGGSAGSRHVLAPDQSVSWPVSIPTRRCQEPTFGQPLHSGEQYRASVALAVQLGTPTRWLTATDSSIVQAGSTSGTGTGQSSSGGSSSQTTSQG